MNLSHSDRPDDVIIGGNLSPQYLPEIKTLSVLTIVIFSKAEIRLHYLNIKCFDTDYSIAQIICIFTLITYINREESSSSNLSPKTVNNKFVCK